MGRWKQNLISATLGSVADIGFPFPLLAYCPKGREWDGMNYILSFNGIDLSIDDLIRISQSVQ
jgi:hypothetical protein